jgi:hypothetical protein
MLKFLFQLRTALEKTIALRRYTDSWNFCSILNSKEAWLDLGKAALQNLEIDFGESEHQNTCNHKSSVAYSRLSKDPGWVVQNSVGTLLVLKSVLTVSQWI